MRGKTHARTGYVFWFVAAPSVLDTSTLHGKVMLGIGAIVAAVAAYGPDIDHQHSTISARYTGSKTAKIIAKMLGGHRMGTHSALSIIACFILALGFFSLFLLADPKAFEVSLDLPDYSGTLAPDYTFADALDLSLSAAIGWFAHIFGDALTVQGVGFFYPFSTKRFRLLRLRTSPNKPKPMYPGEALFNTLLMVALIWCGLGILASA